MADMFLFAKYKDIMPKENKGKGQEPQSAPANTEKGQENRPRKRIRQQRSQTDDKRLYNLQW